MARGWESKAVEEQASERAAARSRPAPDAKRLTDAEREQENRLRSLRSSRARVATQLAGTSNPAYRYTLEQALAALDEEIDRASSGEQKR